MVEGGLHQPGDVADVVEAGRFEGVQIVDRPVRLVGGVDPGMPGVEVDDAGVGQPAEGGRLPDHDPPLAPGLTLEEPGVDPVRSVAGLVLAPEGVAGHAVGEDLGRERPIAEVRQQVGRHPDVVVDHPALGDDGLGPDRLVEIGEMQPPRPDLPPVVGAEAGEGLERLSHLGRELGPCRLARELRRHSRAGRPGPRRHRRVP